MMKLSKCRQVNRLIAIIGLVLWPLISIAVDAGEYLGEAQSYFDKGEYRTAVIPLKNALLIDPDNGQARLLLGQTYLRLGWLFGAEGVNPGVRTGCEP